MLTILRVMTIAAIWAGLSAAATAADQPSLESPSGVTAAPVTAAPAPAVPPSTGAEPTYEETVAFIEGNLRYPFAEHDNHCDFIYRDNDRFSAKSLNAVPEVSGWSVILKCAEAKPCIDSRRSSRLAKELRLEVRDFDNAKKVGKAMSHLIQLCGGTKVRPNLFD